MWLLVLFKTSNAQELYVFTEPASNMPSKSISAKLSGKFMNSVHSQFLEHRITPEVMLGLNKNWMVHLTGTFSDMYTKDLRWESVRLYAKYRFFTMDDVHKHFRMAAFAEASHSENDLFYDEISLEGDQSGVQGGLVVTQLWNKIALSSTVSYIQVTTKKPKFFQDSYPYQAFNYSLSAGYLLLPFSYTDYKQLNVNIYTELLGQESIDKSLYFVDLAPAAQFIINSNAKISVGYRFQLKGNMDRMSGNSWLTSFEYVFLNALRKKK